MVIEFSCLTSSPIEERNIGKIVGWHESFLNCACVAYDSGRVDDWIEFFRDSWVTALLHDKFSQLADRIRVSLRTDNGAFVVIEDVLESAEQTGEDVTVAEHRRVRIGDGGDMLPELTRKTISDIGVDFLQKNKVVLNRFYVPTFEAANNAKN
jgi:hypothetical protein